LESLSQKRQNTQTTYLLGKNLFIYSVRNAKYLVYKNCRQQKKIVKQVGFLFQKHIKQFEDIDVAFQQSWFVPERAGIHKIPNQQEIILRQFQTLKSVCVLPDCVPAGTKRSLCRRIAEQNPGSARIQPF